LTEITHYYWDACVFLAYLNKEASYGIHIDHIDQFLDDAKAGHCRLYTSTITLAEITKLNLKSPEYGNFSEFLVNFRSVIVPVDPNPQAMLKASHLRGMIYTKTTGKRKLATPDAIHIATAMALGDTFGVTLDAFHTFDAGAGKGGPDGPGLPILGYEEWCEQCSDDETVKRVIAMKRVKPTHPAPRLVK
jgi:predicted nucleic acid-binding protein